jgi:hypothetical protein
MKIEDHIYRYIVYAPFVDLFSVLIPRGKRIHHAGHYSSLSEAISARDAAEAAL